MLEWFVWKACINSQGILHTGKEKNDDLFKRLENLTLSSQYIFSLINFITNNKEHFQTNAEVHSVHTRHKHYPHKPTTNLSCFQKSAYYAGIKIGNNMLSDLKNLMNVKAQFKIALK
jgi:hypothetical protein